MAETDKGSAGVRGRLILAAWVAACCIAALFIPRYDFGFDGVKVWFYLCALMLVGMVGGTLLFESLHRRESADPARRS